MNLNRFVMFKSRNERFTVAFEKKGLVLIDNSKKPIQVRNEDLIKIFKGIQNNEFKIVGYGQYGKPVA